MITRVEVQKAKADAKTNRKPNYRLMLIFFIVLAIILYIARRLVKRYL
jgi:hypothetical protein